MKNFKKSKIIALVSIVMIMLTGCGVRDSASGTIEDPKTVYYEIEYVTAGGNNYKCLWYLKDYSHGSMDCVKLNGPAPVGVAVESDHYEIEYARVDNETYECLWYSKQYRRGSMDCTLVE